MLCNVCYFAIVCQCGEYKNYSHCRSMIITMLCQWLLLCLTFISCLQFCLSDTCTRHLCNTNCQYKTYNRLMVLVDGVIGIFHSHNPSGCTMALGLTQPLTEMSTRNVCWGVKATGAQGWQPYYLHVTTVLKSGSMNCLEPSGPFHGSCLASLQHLLEGPYFNVDHWHLMFL
jgi:hypothetical protein